MDGQSAILYKTGADRAECCLESPMQKQFFAIYFYGFRFYRFFVRLVEVLFAANDCGFACA